MCVYPAALFTDVLSLWTQQGNPIEHPIEFKMAVADLKLQQVATAFSLTIPTESGTCSADLIIPATVRNTVAQQLGINDKTRIEVGQVWCKGDDMVADLKIRHPSVRGTVPQRRLGSPESSESAFGNENMTAIDAYHLLMDASLATDSSEGSDWQALRMPPLVMPGFPSLSVIFDSFLDQTTSIDILLTHQPLNKR